MEFTIACDLGTINVTGKPIELEGFEEFSFFIHPAHNRRGRLSITEVVTGRTIGHGSDKEETIKNALIDLTTHDLSLEERIKRAGKVEDRK